MVARMKGVKTPRMLRRALDIASRGKRTPFCCFFLLFSSLSPSSLLRLSFPLHPLPHLCPTSSAPSSSSHFYYKPLGGVCTQLSRRFVEQQDGSFIVLNLKYALQASWIKLGNRLYQRT